jgi:hypothetical protein
MLYIFEFINEKVMIISSKKKKKHTTHASNRVAHAWKEDKRFFFLIIGEIVG